jgi:hypothetical protein
MVTVMRVAGNIEGEGGKAMATATRVAGEQMATATKRVMATKIREAGDKGGNGKGGKSNGNGEKRAMARRTAMVFSHPSIFDSYCSGAA